MEYILKRKWAVLGVILLYIIPITLLYFQEEIKREVALMNLKEEDVDTSMICFEDDTPIGYAQFFAQNGGGASPIPLMTLDKQSDPSDAEVDEEILAVFHAFPYAEPNVDNNYFDKRSPIGKWVGRGMAQQPFYFWGGTNNRNKVCNKTGKHGVLIPEPNMLSLFLLLLTLMGGVIGRIHSKKSGYIRRLKKT